MHRRRSISETCCGPIPARRNEISVLNGNAAFIHLNVGKAFPQLGGEAPMRGGRASRKQAGLCQHKSAAAHRAQCGACATMLVWPLNETLDHLGGRLS